MALWSDGRTRSDDYTGDALYCAIREYYAIRNEELILGLRWDNEWMREQIKQRDAQAPKTLTASTHA